MKTKRNIAIASVGVALATAVLSWAVPASATSGASFTETAIPLAVLDPGQTTTHHGITYIKGMTIVQIELSPSPLLNGRAKVVLDLEINAEGNAVFTAQAFKETGTWDFSASPPQFTRTGGVWEGEVHGAGNMAGNLAAAGTLYGILGDVKGMEYTIEGGGPANGIASYTVVITQPRTRDLDFELLLRGIQIRAGVKVDIHASVFVNEKHPCEGDTVLGLHGMICAGSNWKPLAESLFADNDAGRKVGRFVALDMPGRNGSGVPVGMAVNELTLEDYVAIVFGALDALREQNIKPQTLLGHSMGGEVIQMAQQQLLARGSSLRRQYNIKSVLLLASGALQSQPGPSFWWAIIDPSQDFLLVSAAAWQGVFANSLGQLVIGTPTVAEITAYHYAANEPMSIVMEETAFPSFQAPTVEAGIFAPRYQTTLQMVNYEQDPFSPADPAGYIYLTGDSQLTHYVAVPGADVCHALHIAQPGLLMNAIAEKITVP